jgi:hypothetical protein
MVEQSGRGLRGKQVGSLLVGVFKIIQGLLQNKPSFKLTSIENILSR